MRFRSRPLVTTTCLAVLLMAPRATTLAETHPADQLPPHGASPASTHLAAPVETLVSRLRNEVTQHLAAGNGLKARFWLDNRLLAIQYSTEAAEELTQLAWESFITIRDRVATRVGSEASLERPIPEVIQSVLNGLHHEGVRTLRGTGNNALLVELYGRHLELLDQEGPIELDCDAAVVTVFAVLEQIDRHAAEPRLVRRLAAASHSDHLALAVLEDEVLIADMNARFNSRGQVKLRWHSGEDYRRALEEQRAEDYVLLHGWAGLMSNAWEIAAARLNKLRQYELSTHFAEQALAIHNNNVGALNSRGVAYKHLGQLEKALADIDRAIELKGKSALLHTNRADVLTRLDRNEEAVLAADTAIELSPEFAIAHLRRYAAQRRLGNHELARIDFASFRELAGPRRETAETDSTRGPSSRKRHARLRSTVLAQRDRN